MSPKRPWHLKLHFTGSSSRPYRTDRASMASGAVDHPLLGLGLEILQLPKLLVDRSVHSHHLAGSLLGTLVVASVVICDVAMRARDSESPAISHVHDEQE